MINLLLVLSIITDWGPDFPLSRDTIGSEGCYIRSSVRRVAADNLGRVYVVWHTRDGSGIKFRRYNGFAWEPETTLVMMVNGCQPTISVDKNNRLHMVCDKWVAGDRIIYKRYEGGLWQPETVISKDTITQRGSRPALAVDTFNRLHIVWSNEVFRRFVYKRFNGTTWDTMISLCPWHQGSYPEPYWLASSIAADLSGNVHITWCGDITGNYEIYYKRCRNNVWEPETMLTNAPDHSVKPNLACDSRGRVHIVWVDCRYGNQDIFYKRFNGTNWEPDTPLVRVNYVKDWPNICVDKDDRVHIVWTDWRDVGGSEIYYKYFDGIRWSQDYRLTSAWGYSYLPFIAADSELRLHVVWTDSRDGIGYGMPYYKRGRVTGVEEIKDQIADNRLQISPNPFRCKATVKFEIRNSKSEITLRVYDAGGRLVKQFNHSTIQPFNQIVWDASGMPSGAYFIELSNEDYHIVTKVIKI